MRKCYIILIFLILFKSNLKSFEIPFFDDSFYKKSLGEIFSAPFYNPAGIVGNTKNKITIYGSIKKGEEYYINNHIGIKSIFIENFGFSLDYGTFGKNLIYENLMYSGIKIQGVFGYKINNILFGLGAKIIYYNSGEIGGVFYDSGVIYKLNNYINIGVVIKNLLYSGTFIILNNEGNVYIITPPVLANTGISIYPLKNVIFSFNIYNIFETESFIILENKKLKMKKIYSIDTEIKIIKNIFNVYCGVEGGEDKNNLDDEFYLFYNIKSGVTFKIKFINLNFLISKKISKNNDNFPLEIFIELSGNY